MPVTSAPHDPGEVERHAAPAAADVEDAGAGADEELGGDQALLGELGLVERHVGALEEGAGILHVAVEEEPVEPLVEVVVVGDVGARRLEADGAQHRRVGDAAAEVEDPAPGVATSGRVLVLASAISRRRRPASMTSRPSMYISGTARPGSRRMARSAPGSAKRSASGVPVPSP